MRTKIPGLLAIGLLANPVLVNAVAVDWQTASGSTATGDLGGIAVTLTDACNPSVCFDAQLGAYDLSGADYSGAPLSASQGTVDYTHNSNWTVAFDRPIELLLYGKYWRGPNAPAVDPPTFSYTFSRPFSIVSGFGTATVTGSTLTIPTTGGFADGILSFGYVSSLSLVSNDAGVDAGYQAMTFGAGSLSVPEPGTLALLGLGLAGLGLSRRRR